MKKQISQDLSARVEKTKTGFSAYSEKYPVFTTGKTFTELKENLAEAYELYFDSEDKKISPTQIQISIDVSQFFQYYKVLNARYLADRIGMNPTLLSQYVKDRKKPSARQVEKILRGLQEVGKELSELNFSVR